ncbi:MAG: 50S ribosomal protein L3 [Candidatus Doudnabacteria bacterium]|nr:50S ribosomal protein L3 [Candidatus Doudnabacteria bacterium]
MSKFLIAEKLHMSQIFAADGRVIPVTILKSPGVKVTQVKGPEKDKYSAVQVGAGKRKKLNKAMGGHLKDLGNFQVLKEFRVEDSAKFKRGDEIKLDTFVAGDKVKVTAQMKGRGFAGPVKKYRFKGAPKTHGHDHPRAVGSIGSTYPQHVLKGTRMAGRMGGTATVKNLEVVDVDLKRNLIAVKGAVPGPNGGFVMIESV